MIRKRKFQVVFAYMSNQNYGISACTVTVDRCHKKLSEKQLDVIRQSIISKNFYDEVVILNLIELRSG